MPPAYTYKSEESIEPPAPLITALMVLLCFWFFFQGSTHGLLSAHGWAWLQTVSFSGGKFVYQLDHSVWDKMLGMMYNATFAQANIFHFIGNIYFLWVFGSTVESRLGPIRYLPLVLVCGILGWMALGFEIGKTSSYLYVGPGLVTAAIIGMYLNFIPEKKINPTGQFRTYKLFRDEKDPNPAESFGISPWWLIVAFVVFQVVLHFMISGGNPKFSTMTPMSGFIAMIVGFILAIVLVVAATGQVQGNPLKRLAVKRYQQLRRLDMTHEQAVLGVSKLLSVPSEQIKQWVSSGGGPLPDR